MTCTRVWRRNHFPNDGNPGLSYTNDQIGLNARSFDDILLLDAALLDTTAEHAAAAQAAPPLSRVRIGLPQVPFVRWHRNAEETLQATAGMMSKYEQVTQVLSAAGAQLVEEEWPPAPSDSWISTDGFEEAAKGQGPGDTSCRSYSGRGQAATWVQDNLGAKVSNIEIYEDIFPIPGGHDPKSAFSSSRSQGCSESQFREFMATRDDVLQLYNSYFDAHNVDMILSPGQPTEAVNYIDAANLTVPVGLFPSGTQSVTYTASP